MFTKTKRVKRFPQIINLKKNNLDKVFPIVLSCLEFVKINTISRFLQDCQFTKNKRLNNNMEDNFGQTRQLERKKLSPDLIIGDFIFINTKLSKEKNTF